jgi:hypothetical protein
MSPLAILKVITSWHSINRGRNKGSFGEKIQLPAIAFEPGKSRKFQGHGKKQKPMLMGVPGLAPDALIGG